MLLHAVGTHHFTITQPHLGPSVGVGQVMFKDPRQVIESPIQGRANGCHGGLVCDHGRAARPLCAGGRGNTRRHTSPAASDRIYVVPPQYSQSQLHYPCGWLEYCVLDLRHSFDILCTRLLFVSGDYRVIYRHGG